jgi:hypothetical protein
MMWNKPYLQAHKLKAPAEWMDLISRPGYYAPPNLAPSRSGTTHLTVERFYEPMDGKKDGAFCSTWWKYGHGD